MRLLFITAAIMQILWNVKLEVTQKFETILFYKWQFKQDCEVSMDEWSTKAVMEGRLYNSAPTHISVRLRGTAK